MITNIDYQISMTLTIICNKASRYFLISLCLIPHILYLSSFFLLFLGILTFQGLDVLFDLAVIILFGTGIFSFVCQGKLVNLYLNRNSDKQPFELSERWMNVIFYTFLFNFIPYFLIAVDAFSAHIEVSIMITTIIGILFYLAIRFKRNPNKQSIARKLSLGATFILPFLFLFLIYMCYYFVSR